ncbi:MAG: MEKHLA domain-containing protein [Synechococcales bacterium]|nr:MEKHLA domain-containing protein [Synechococcales bacterium]
MSEMFPWQLPSVQQQSQNLLYSFHHWTGQVLIPCSGTWEEQAKALFEANLVIVSHGMEADPIFNYGNQPALKLWDYSWEDFTQMPSRQSAEPMVQSERDRLLATAREKGYIDDYQGIRISSQGRRFWIKQVILWQVIDTQHCCQGQAATFSQWQWVEDGVSAWVPEQGDQAIGG